MATILDTFLTQFRWDVDKTGIKSAEKTMDQFKTKALGVFAAVAGVLGGGALVNSVANASAEVLKYADGLGIAVEKQSEMDFAAQRLGVNLDTLRGHMFTLSRQIGEAARGEGAFAGDLEAFGLSAVDASGKAKTVDVVLDEVRAKMQTLGTIERTDLVDKLGFDEETIGILSASPEMYAELTAEARKYGVVTRAEAEAAKAFNTAIANAGTALTKVANTLGAVFFPPLAKAFEMFAAFTGFMRTHTRFFKVLGIVLGGIALAWGAVRAQAIAAQIAMFAIPLAIAAIIIAIAAVAEDLFGFFTGAESLTGKLVQRWPALGTALYAIRDAAVEVWGAFKTAMSPVVDTLGALWATVKGAFGTIVEAFKDTESSGKSFQIVLDLLVGTLKILLKVGAFVLNTIFSLINAVLPPIADVIASVIDGLQAAGRLAQKAWNFVKGIFGADEAAELKVGVDEDSIAQAAEMTVAAQGTGTVAQTASVTNTNTGINGPVNVTVQGGDSREIAANIDGALRDQMRNTAHTFDSTIRL